METIAGRVLVTGAGGFVGGHVARRLAASGVPVRGLSRRPPIIEPDDPAIEWVIGDLRDPDLARKLVAGVWGIVHAAGWVSLGPDRRGLAWAVNVEATLRLLDEAESARVSRFVYTSTLWTVASGTAERPANESTPWNLDVLRSPYLDSKREAERRVLERERSGFRTVVICPGLVIGPRDVRPTSTRLLLEMAGAPGLALLPNGGIPVVESGVIAQAHHRALETPRTGRRYNVVGPYLSYPAMARLVATVAGQPRRVVIVPAWCRAPLTGLAGWVNRLGWPRSGEFSAATIQGGFLALHVEGRRANAEFGLDHPPPIVSIARALEDHRRSGRAPWLDLKAPSV